MDPTPEEAANVTRALKKLRARPVAWAPVTTGGHTPARRWVVTLEDGRTAFVKVATDELTASWLRDEHPAYSLLRGSSFMPTYLGFYDDGAHPVLEICRWRIGRLHGTVRRWMRCSAVLPRVARDGPSDTSPGRAGGAARR